MTVRTVESMAIFTDVVEDLVEAVLVQIEVRAAFHLYKALLNFKFTAKSAATLFF